MINFKNFFFRFLILLFSLLLFIFFIAKDYSKYVFSDIQNNFLRLHIIANSDSSSDQILKIKVRDAVLDYATPLLQNSSSKDDAKKILNQNLDALNNVVSSTIHNYGSQDTVETVIGKSKFPERKYGSLILPSGTYDSLQVKIGNAEGQNWWCIMYPSLCVTNNFISKNTVPNDIVPEEASLLDVNSQNKPLKIKFKIIEFFENMW